MENYSLLMGDSSVDENGGGVDGGAFRGTSPSPACRNRDSCPPDLGFAMAALEGFSYRGFSVSRREINHIATGTAPSLDGELLSSSWETAALMKMAVVSMEEPSGGTSRPGGVPNRLSPDLGFAMAAARKVSRTVAFPVAKVGVLHCALSSVLHRPTLPVSARRELPHAGERLKAKVASLEALTTQMEATIEELEDDGEHLRKENEALLSGDDDDYEEEAFDMEPDTEDEAFIKDEEEEPGPLMPEEDPEEPAFDEDAPASPEGPVVDLDDF
ncbi:hypothetical protein QYE76_041759 [Lolium multiflorum]|uniref:Uncharacterized protein n=1 Tax=Lolium multiflorum TaxID=4521 RepID=A0AAD8WWC4_LOLMU|nr:hypothetical protein QYE76_041759 [Lolium multiflorum]